MIQTPERIVEAARRRIEAARDDIRTSLEFIQAGAPLKAEPVHARAVARVAAVTKVSPETAARIVDYDDPASLGLAGEALRKAEALQGKTVDYVGVAWLDAGRIASNAVGRIVFRHGQAVGTGFLVSQKLLLTNNHVIPSPAAARRLVVEFGYEIRLGERAPSPVRFELAPETFFETAEQDDLDFTLVALGSPLSARAGAKDFGFCPLSASSAKHSNGEPVNIVEHPDGDYKQVVFRENRIIHRGETVLHYLADTEPGSSGSPVFNDEWQVVALHHWGAPHRELTENGQPLRTDVNEGIRISAIVTELERRAARMSDAQKQMVREALNAPPPGEFGTRRVMPAHGPGAQMIFPRPVLDDFSGRDFLERNPSGGAGEAGGAPAGRIDRNYSNRRGYNGRFLPGFSVPLPQLSAGQQGAAARVRGVGNPGNPFELKYEHFSVVLNAERRMAFYSICNIDGAKRIIVDRTTGQAVSGPEATETWATDPRVPEEAQLSDAFYSRLRRDLRTPDDFFARGHLTRREDPNWGQFNAAERANNDTYHHTNACPQVNNAFNASQKAWQGIENFVLNSADDSNLRVTVITGPVFGDDDPTYEDEEFGPVQLPRKFWKIVARVEDREPMVFAVLADQSEAMDLLLAERPESREAAWAWPRRLSTEYKSTVAEIAGLTGLDFGDLANFDVFAREARPEGREIVRGPEVFFPRHTREGGFGRFSSIGEFLRSWEDRLREAPEQGAAAAEPPDEGAERRRRRPRPRPQPQPRPQPRGRKVVEVEASVARVFADDLSGAKHQQFTIIPTSWTGGDSRAQAEVEAAIADRAQVRVAVRFGDSRGLADRIPGIRTNVALRLKGEWISARDAFDVGGEDMPVLHFTHDPLGWICTPDRCFS